MRQRIHQIDIKHEGERFRDAEPGRARHRPGPVRRQTFLIYYVKPSQIVAYIKILYIYMNETKTVLCQENKRKLRSMSDRGVTSSKLEMTNYGQAPSRDISTNPLPVDDVIKNYTCELCARGEGRRDLTACEIVCLQSSAAPYYHRITVCFNNSFTKYFNNMYRQFFY